MDIENALNGFRSRVGQLVDRAAGPRPPDEVDAAQRLPGRDARVPPRRRSRSIADALPSALARPGAAQRGHRGHRRRDAGLPGQRRDLQRALRAAAWTSALEGRRARRGHGLPEQPVPARHRVAPARRRGRPRRAACAAASGGGDEPPRPACTATASARSRSAARRSTPGGVGHASRSADDLTFEVQVANQGENTETDVNGEGHGGQGRRRHRARGADRHDRRRRDQDRRDPAGRAAADRPERADHGRGRAPCPARRRPTTTGQTSRPSSRS